MKRRGYTLIEIMIALGMMVVLLGAVGFAIRANIRVLDESQTQVAEARLARAILEKIARDLRNAVVEIRAEELEVDTESLQKAFLIGSASSSLASLGIDSSALSSISSGQGDSGDSTASESSRSTSGTASGEMPDSESLAGLVPGIYGDLEWIQIDTARMPRGEQFGGKVTRSGSAPTVDRLSPSKTVLYYLGADTGSDGDYGTGRSGSARTAGKTLGSLGYSLDRDGPRYGLFRREKDRLATQYMIDQGLETEEEQYDEALAPEVEAIEFLYYDSQAEQSSRSSRSSSSETGEWVESWDMDEIGYLPKAVRVTVWIRRTRPGGQTTDGLTGEMSGIQTIAYSLIVPLPVASETGTSEEVSE